MTPITLAGLQRTLRRRLDGWLDHLAPRACALCGAGLAPGAFPGLCGGCLQAMPGARRVRCARCALPVQGACLACAEADLPFDRALAAADYAPPLDRLVTSMKFGRQLGLARPLGEVLAASWLGAPDAPPLDCLVPVPLGAARLAQRGFNQALEMARAMSAALAAPLPVHPRRLLRVRETPAQAGLGLADRRRNLVGCFACDQGLDGLRVGLVDDVMTSGSTLSEAARALRRAGAASVVALVVARAD
jgi:ComF family protein